MLSASAAVFVLSVTALSSYPTSPNFEAATVTALPPRDQKIQVAILLDVSNSMDGLIDQAKAQLWNMVSVMGRVKCENGLPKIEIALYEYGKDSNDPKKGFIKQISDFSSDLDNLSQQLFALKTYGGSEYCGQVIHTSLDELKWDTASTNYKVIFIAGNEDFLQGNIQYTDACNDARKKGVIVNTIYCGDRMQGIREHWDLGAECGNGSYTNINQNAKQIDIPTPYDTTLIALNNKLNSTYLFYGSAGSSNYRRQEEVDRMNYKFDQSAAAKRVSVKGKKQLYDNSSWDLVDAASKDSTGKLIRSVDKKTLPDSLQNKSAEELEKIVKTKNAERTAIQKEIATVTVNREAYIISEKAKITKPNEATLETEVEKMIREQVKRFNMRVE